MNIIDKHNRLNKSIEAYEIEERKDIQINILDARHKNKIGKYELVNGEKKDNRCNEKDRELCDRICKDYCLLFKGTNDDSFIWSCYIKSWERL